MSNLRFLIAMAAAAGLALGQSVEAPQSESFFQKPSNKSADEDRLLQKGKAAIDAGRWDEALEAFSTIVSEKGAHADEALYWKAYALNKIARRAEALTAIAKPTPTAAGRMTPERSRSKSARLPARRSAPIPNRMKT